MEINNYVKVMCPGTFGEFVQGKTDNLPFLITAPVNRYSTVSYTPAPIQDLHVDTNLLKVKKMCLTLQEILQRPFTGFLEVDTEIPYGKGLASSSADIIGAGSVLLHNCGVPASQHGSILELAARRVEPTDGVMHGGVVCFAHHTCQLIESLGSTSYEIVGCILPGEIDTCTYDSSKIIYSSAQLRDFDTAIELARTGIEKGDIELLGRASTLSAVINEDYLPKDKFVDVLKLAKSTKAAGVVVAHSGTAIGLLMARNVTPIQRDEIHSELANLYNCIPESFISEMAGPIATRCAPVSAAKLIQSDSFFPLAAIPYESSQVV